MGRLYPDRPIVGIGAIIMHDGKILLEKRKNDPGKGKWSVPGGVVELGENVTQTVIREVKEETGLDVAEPEHIDVVDQITRDEGGRIKYHFVIIDYLVKLKGGMLKAASDADELEWVSLSEVEKYDLTGAFRAFFERNKNLLKKLS